VNKNKLQKLIHKELENIDGVDYGESLLMAINIAKKVIRLSELESLKDSRLPTRETASTTEEE
jgi:hypothetical protein